jgi:hypothetical protein
MRSHNPMMLWMTILQSMLTGGGSKSERKPTGGHRRRNYVPTAADFERLAAASHRREQRAAKRYEMHRRCLANNDPLVPAEYRKERDYA